MLRAMAAASLAVSSWVIFGQTSPPTPLPEFTAVSIKPNKSGDSRMMMRGNRGGRLDATNVPVRNLITWAYQVRDFQISGEPGWVDSERFDVVTKSDGNPRFDFLKPELQTMFQSVLVDRFKLALHRETKELPVYSLIAAKNGPKIHPVDEGDCPEVPTPENPCRFLRRPQFAQLKGEKAPMPALVLMLSVVTQKAVVDKTGLTGSFSYTLDWKKYLDQLQASSGPEVPQIFDPSSIVPAISSALEEQLGLKLESAKGPVEILVIDHVERPSEN